MLDILYDSLIDTLKLLPYLLITFILLEFIEHKLTKKNENILTNNKKYGPLIGGLLGGLCITGSRIDSWFLFQFATATGTCNMIHDCIFDLTILSRDYPPSEYGVRGYLDYYFQLAEGCDLDLKNNISLNPQYLPNTILNN
jgi:hypothetical protein